MSIELIGHEYLQNVYHNDISIFKKDDKYEINYVITVFSELGSNIGAEGLFLKTFLCKETETMQSLGEGKTPLENEAYEMFALRDFPRSEKDGMAMYSHKISFIINKEDFDSLSVFSCLSKSPERFIYNGPVFFDVLIKPDGFPSTRNFVASKSSGDYGGAIHEHEGGFMEGSFHSSKQHESVELINKEDSKILFLDSLKYNRVQGERIKTSYIKSFPFVEDKDGNVSFVFAANLAEIALQNSKSSKSLFMNNPKLFLELSKYLTVKNIKIYRETKKKQSGVNKLMMPVESTVTVTSEVVCDCSPENNVLNKVERFLLSNRQTVNVNRETLAETQPDRITTQQNVTLDDLSDARPISCIEQIDPSEQKLFYYQFTDYEAKETINKDYSYSIEIQIENYASKYISTLIRSLNSSIETLLQYQREVDVNNYYDHNSLSYDNEFLKMVFSTNNVQLNNKMQPMETEKEKIKGMFHYKAVQIFSQCTELVNIRGYNFQNLFNSLNFSRTNNFMFKKATELFIDLKNILEPIYLHAKNKHASSTSFEESSVYNVQGLDGIIQVKYELPESFKRSINQSIGYSFLSQEEFPEILKISSQHIERRGLLERQKFFLGNISTSDPVVSNLGSSHKLEFLDFQKKANSYFTPLLIKIGNRHKVLDDFNKRTTESKFFNVLNYSRKASQEKEMIVQNDIEYLSSVLPSISIVNSPKDSLVVSQNEEGYYIESGKLINSSYFSSGLSIRKTLDLNEIFTNKEVYSRVQRSITSKKVTPQIKMSSFNLNSENNLFSNTNKDLSIVPLQIKSIMASESPSVKNNLVSNNFKDFQDPEVEEVVKQIFLNIKEIKAFEGFSMLDGVYNLDDANYVSLTRDNFLNFKSKNFMCVLENYELEISNKKDEKDFKIFDKFFMVINRKQERPKLVSYSPKNKELVTYSKNYFNRNSVMRQNAENFGKALRMPLGSNRGGASSGMTGQATTQTITIGATNATY